MIEIVIGITLGLVAWNLRKAFYDTSDVYKENIELRTTDLRADNQDDFNALAKRIDEIKEKQGGKWHTMADIQAKMKSDKAEQGTSHATLKDSIMNKQFIDVEIGTVTDFCQVTYKDKCFTPSLIEIKYQAGVVDDSANLAVSIDGIDMMMSEHDYYMLYDDMLK